MPSGSVFSAGHALRVAGFRLSSPPPSPALQLDSGKMFQHIEIRLFRVVRQRRTANRAGGTDHGCHAGMDFRVVDHIFMGVEETVMNGELCLQSRHLARDYGQHSPIRFNITVLL